jgi:hypothetical protein
METKCSLKLLHIYQNTAFYPRDFVISKQGTHSLDKIKSHILAWSFIKKDAGIPKCDEIRKIKVKYKFIQLESLAFVNDVSIIGYTDTNNYGQNIFFLVPTDLTDNYFIRQIISSLLRNM